MKFNATMKSELRHFLFHYTPIHDATFSDFQYKRRDKIIEVTLYNPCEKAFVHFIFDNVCLLLLTDTDAWGNDQSINGFCLVDEYSLPRALLKDTNLSVDDMLYFVFQMFSGNEIYILCDHLDISVV